MQITYWRRKPMGEVRKFSTKVLTIESLSWEELCPRNM